MEVKAPSAAFAWLFWLLWVAGWIIMLSGSSALQQVHCRLRHLPGDGAAGSATTVIASARQQALLAALARRSVQPNSHLHKCRTAAAAT